MSQSQEVKEWPGFWAVRGVETGGTALRPVGGILWVSFIGPSNTGMVKSAAFLEQKR